MEHSCTNEELQWSRTWRCCEKCCFLCSESAAKPWWSYQNGRRGEYKSHYGWFRECSSWSYSFIWCFHGRPWTLQVWIIWSSFHYMNNLWDLFFCFTISDRKWGFWMVSTSDLYHLYIINDVAETIKSELYLYII